MAAKPSKIKRVAKGDRPTAAHYNQLVDGINSLMDLVGGPEKVVPPTLRMVEMDEDLNSYGRDKTANRLRYNRYISESNDPIEDADIDETFVSDIQYGIHLDGERLPLWWDKASGTSFVIPVMNWHMAKLTSKLAAGGHATATIWKRGSSAEEASTITGVTVYDWMLVDGVEDLSIGTPVIVMLHRQSRLWYVVNVSPLLTKEWARATANSAYTTASATVAGTLTHQYGHGTDHVNTSVTLKNLETKVAGVYVFSGSSGSACWARYTGHDNDWLIVIPECP